MCPVMIVSGKFRREFRRSFFQCSCLGLGPTRGSVPVSGSGPGGPGAMRGGGASRGDRTSYRLTHLSPSNYNNGRSEYGRSHTSFIENNNRKPRSDSTVSDNPATRLTVATDLDWQHPRRCSNMQHVSFAETSSFDAEHNMVVRVANRKTERLLLSGLNQKANNTNLDCFSKKRKTVNFE